MSYDPDIIHSCHRCGRGYAVRPIEGMNHWHFYNVYCSAWCAMPDDRREQWGYVVSGDESVFLYLLDQARGVYQQLLDQQQGTFTNEPLDVYWYGWTYRDAHPYRFASAFMDSTERSLFLSTRERKRYADYLFALTNQMHYGVDS